MRRNEYDSTKGAGNLFIFPIYEVKGKGGGKGKVEGKPFLISKHGAMSYTALGLDGRRKKVLQKARGVDTLQTEDGLGNVFGKKETKTKADIIVKPDGSRVLVVTTNVGGMETTMTLEISKPTNMQNDNLKQDSDNNGTSVSSETATISNDIPNIVSECSHG